MPGHKNPKSHPLVTKGWDLGFLDQQLQSTRGQKHLKSSDEAIFLPLNEKRYYFARYVDKRKKQ